MVRFSCSVRASNVQATKDDMVRFSCSIRDNDFQRVLNICRMSSDVLLKDPSLITEFQTLVAKVFTSSWDEYVEKVLLTHTCSERCLKTIDREDGNECSKEKKKEELGSKEDNAKDIISTNSLNKYFNQYLSKLDEQNTTVISPFGQCRLFFVRHEYQCDCGTLPHVHGILAIKKPTRNGIINYIDKYISKLDNQSLQHYTNCCVLADQAILKYEIISYSCFLS